VIVAHNISIVSIESELSSGYLYGAFVIGLGWLWQISESGFKKTKSIIVVESW